MRKFSYLLILTLLATGIFSCRNVKEVTYFQPGDSTRAERNVVYPNFNKDRSQPKLPGYIPTIQPLDILSVYVSSLSPEASSFFNTFTPAEKTGQSDVFTTRSDVGYLVDPEGYIEMPLVGKIKIGGLTTVVAKDTISQRLEKFLQYPTVRIYLENFRVIILGEVNRPGVYNVTNEKISIPEALGLAGDLNIYGNREEVMLIREENGIKTYITIDLTSRELFTAPHYYLRSNDILYVSPVKARVAQADNFYRVMPLIVSTLTFLAVIVTRIIEK